MKYCTLYFRCLKNTSNIADGSLNVTTITNLVEIPGMYRLSSFMLSGGEIARNLPDNKMRSPLNILISDNAVSRQIYSLHQNRDLCQLYGTPRLKMLSFMSLFVKHTIFYSQNGRQRKKATSGLIKSEDFLSRNKDRLIHIMLRSVFNDIFADSVTGDKIIDYYWLLLTIAPYLCQVIIASRRHEPLLRAGAGPWLQLPAGQAGRYLCLRSHWSLI